MVIPMYQAVPLILASSSGVSRMVIFTVDVWDRSRRLIGLLARYVQPLYSQGPVATYNLTPIAQHVTFCIGAFRDGALHPIHWGVC
jgi:hypothetical protein